MTDTSLPYTIHGGRAASEDPAGFVRTRGLEVEAALREHGAVLFRELGIASDQAFANLLAALEIPLNAYVDGNSPRRKLQRGVYTASEYHAELPISLHNELSYAASWPSRLYFCCVKPAASGGSTTLADSRKILADIHPELVSEFKAKGVTYVRNLPSAGNAGFGKSWQDTYETDDRRLVESLCRASQIDYEWREDDGLRLVQTRPATALHEPTHQEVWFNQAEQFHPSSNPADVYEALQDLYSDDPFDMPQYACFGDRTPITPDALAHIRDVMRANKVDVNWKRGDFLIVDNLLAAHGRSPFAGERQVLVSMSA